MPTLDEIIAQTIGEQEWRLLRLEEENRRLRETLRAQHVTPEPDEATEWPTESPG